MKGNPLSNRQRFFLIIFGVLLATVSAEILLRFYVMIDPRGHHVHDTRGWRNAYTLKHADIVALGDSQTYGYNVSFRDAWPQRLGQMLHRSVYQMASGGFGPGQYLLLFGEAANLHPNVLLATYYLGNDLFDAFWLAYHVGPMKGTLPAPELDSLVTTDSRIRALALRAESIDPGLVRQGYLWCQDHRRIPDSHLQQVHNILSAPPLMPIAVKAGLPLPSTGARINSFLEGWLTLYAVVRDRLQPLVTRMIPPRPYEDYGPPLCVHYHDRQMRTVFGAGYRLMALDKTDPRMGEGERIGLLAYKALGEKARRAGIRFYVVVIDTKETAFRARAEASLRNEPYLSEIWQTEREVRSRAFAFFKRNSINVIDTLPQLEALIASGLNPYPENADDHPMAPGYNAYALAVAERLEHDGLGGSP